MASSAAEDVLSMRDHRVPIGSTPVAEPGRAESFELLFRRHYAALLRLAVVMLGSREAAEDAVQEAFVALHRNWRTMRDPAAAEAYLRSAVLNGSRSWVRRQAVQRARRSVYLMSTRDGGDQDIWVAPRSRDGQIGEPELLPAPVNSAAHDFCPTPLRGKSLLFVSTRGDADAYGTPACGGGDIYLTRQSPATGEWAAPRNLGCGPGGPNGPGTEFGPSVVETDSGTWLYFSSGGGLGSGTQDIYMSQMLADGTFGPRVLVDGLSLPSPSDDLMPIVRKDGLEVVFASNRAGSGAQGDFDIWSATRTSTSDPWSPLRVVNLGVDVNGPGRETRPALSWDGSRLYFGRSGDIYLSSR